MTDRRKIGRRGAQSPIDGFAVALERDGPMSIAVYVKAAKAGRIIEFEHPAISCRECKTRTTVSIGFTIGKPPHTQRIVGCPSCMPKARACARCEQLLNNETFDITTSRTLGFKFESYCKHCRRARGREYYEVHRDDPRSTPATQRCDWCREVKPADAFSRDGRYATGLLGVCIRCRS